ncbi:MAG: hypothetical protein V1253_00825 [Alphaproteobacteria bacterium]|jgi:hypothetical protein|nr:hypothetical protein [Alphaproteobacteria bacterium]HIJ44095.1 hypothetical protein [Rhodospirillaceae bacterium]HJP53192.1 hypothetical protein [Rhodospirillales bacterium]MEE1561741.1 hypothetical protein [Alphaproteobacteria bacterium]MEE1568365.1 hypothetical protein [Alphaproteobacteria bacterium]
MIKSGFIGILSLMFLAACTETRYVNYQGEEAFPDIFSRQVEFNVSKAFYRDPPDCVVVLPSTTADKGQGQGDGRGRVVEDALARQLSGKVNRVIGPNERDHLVRRLAVDLSRPGDRRVLARQARCGFFVQAKPWGGESVYAVVWTQTRVGLEVVMTRAGDDGALWQARHVATRSGGGLPLSPISVASNAFMAARLNTDGDVPLSLLDDTLRRMVRTLPDTRYAMERRPGG